MVYASKFNESSDLSTTYLGQTKMEKGHKNQSRRMIFYYWSRICFRKIIGWYRMSNFVGNGSNSYYLQCKTLHALPKLSSNMQRIQVGNGQYASVLFVIPVIIDIHGHRFKIFTLVSEIHDNVDLVMGMKIFLN